LRPFVIVALILGLATIVVLVVVFGAPTIGSAFLRLGPLGFVAVCLAHGPVVAILGAAWRFCLPVPSLVPVRGAIAARVLREAGAEVLPFSEFGGFVVGMRALALAGASGVEALASTLVDLTAEAAAQLAFIALGLGSLYRLRPDALAIRPAAAALAAIGALLALAIVAARRKAGFMTAPLALARRRLAAFGPAEASLSMTFDLLGRPGLFARAIVLHLLGWLAIAAEAWFVLYLIGAPVSYIGALALEGCLFALRSLAFFTPAALGVQEGAYALIAPLIGLDVADALALSLVKRARDLVIGAPALLLWQRLEAGRLWREQ
jgi:glycosyltransferase 2 family protein